MLCVGDGEDERKYKAQLIRVLIICLNNPKNRETVEIKPKKLPFLLCGKGLPDWVNINDGPITTETNLNE